MGPSVVDILSNFLFFMIWELLLKAFIPVLRIFDDEDDIFIFFSGIFENPTPTVKTNGKRNIN